MKKLLAYFLVFSVSTTILAEEVHIDHPVTEEPVRLVVPEDYDALRSAYLQMARLYLGERHDLEEALDIIEENDGVIAELEDQVDSLMESNQELENELGSEIRPDPLKLQPMAGVGYDFIESKRKYSAGLQASIFDTFIVGLQYSTPITVSLLIGMTISM